MNRSFIAKIKWIHRAIERLSKMHQSQGFDSNSIRSNHLDELLSSWPASIHEALLQSIRDPFLDLLLHSLESINWSRIDLIESLARNSNEINQWHQSLHESSLSATFRSTILNYQRAEDKNQASLQDYLRYLLDAYPKLMIIRVDLHHSAIDRRLVDDWDRLKASVDSKFPHLAGYAVKFEYGRDRGLHAHACFVFDAAYVRQDVSIAAAIGNLWSELTSMPHSYFNCNHDRHVSRMENPCVGVFVDRPHSLYEGLHHMCHYLTKADTLARWLIQPHSRSFRKGQLNANQIGRLQRRSNRYVIHVG